MSEPARLPTPAEAREMVAGYQQQPVRFVREILGGDPWETPEAILRALAAPHARVAVRSAHGTGKTWTAAQAVLWWVCTGGKVVTTAPSWTQVKNLLWQEISLSHSRAKFPLGPAPNQTSLDMAPGVFAIGLSTNLGVRFQGWHGERVLVVLDEAPGIRPDIWEAIEGVRSAGDVRVLAIGNPMAGGGPFRDAFERDAASWTTFHISAFATPNLKGVTPEQLLALPEGDNRLRWGPRQYLVSRSWVREKLIKWGPGTPLYESKVLGNFPGHGEHTLIWLEWLELGRLSTIQPKDGDLLTAGVDVAGPGKDETALCVRKGPLVILEKAWRDPDARGDVVAALAPYKGHLVAVNVDAIGIGYNFAKHLADQGLPVVEVNVGIAPMGISVPIDEAKERFANLKAEIYWSFRERCQKGEIGGLLDDEANAQCSTIRYEHASRGQVAIESKDKARARGIGSPDRAEARILAFAELPVPGDQYGSWLV